MEKVFGDPRLRGQQPPELWEEDVWRCWKHPSLPRTGVCPICLRDRLLRLCQDNVSRINGVGAVRRVRNLIEGEKSRSISVVVQGGSVKKRWWKWDYFLILMKELHNRKSVKVVQDRLPMRRG